MKEAYGMSSSGSMQEAIKGITNPAALFFATTQEKLEQHAKELEEAFPGVPSIGAVGQGYGGTKTVDNGLLVVGLTDVKAVANVIEEISLRPVKYIKRLEEDLRAVGASPENTVCFDICTGADSRVVTTMYSYLGEKKISLVGGTTNCAQVAVNGKLYEDAAGYLILKNTTGKVKIYKENIYKPMEGSARMTATKTDTKNYRIMEIDNKPAENVYREKLGIDKSVVATQTFKNPLGRCYGNEVFLISIKDVVGSSLDCYRQVNNMDALTFMEIDNYQQVVKDTVSKIKSDLPRVSGILSVNCLFRYLYFGEERYWDTYLKEMVSVCNHAGLVGVGEHFGNQHVNQTMCCVAFE